LRFAVVVTSIALLVLAACGGGDDDDDADGGNAEPAGGGAASSRTADIDPCTLLTEAELTAALGSAPAAEASEPAGPFTGCSWGVGDVLVSIASSDNVILGPGEADCPTANLGEDSYLCSGRIKFLVNGIHVSVSTIDPFMTDEQLLALAEAVLPKLEN
jgi:hypothetical protein